MLRRVQRPSLVGLLLVAGALLFASPAQAAPRLRALTLAWFGEFLFRPGGQLGAEVTLADSGPHALLGSAHLTSFYHPHLSVGLGAEVGLGYRASFANGLFLELHGALGYLHTFLAGTTYERDAAGALHTVAAAGNPAFAPSGTGGIGYDLSRRGRSPLELFLRVTGFGQYPVNETWVPHVALQLGLAYRPAW